MNSTIIIALLIITFELHKQGCFRPKPVRKVKVKKVMLVEVIPVLIIGAIPVLGLVLTLLVILNG